MALSVFVLLWRRERRSALWLMVPTVLLFLAGSTPLAEILVGAAERPYGQRSEGRGRRRRRFGRE